MTSSCRPSPGAAARRLAPPPNPAALVTLLAVFVSWTWPVAPAAAEAGPKPNVVLIVSDYMGYRDIQPYGAVDVRTPALSRLAAEGVRMTDFYAAAPVCGPARAALLTGRYPASLGFEKNIRSAADGLSASVPTLPRWLGEAGYRTALLGKWHLGYGSDFTPNAHGFDEFLGHHEWTVGYYDHLTEDGRPGLYENDRVTERDGYLTDLLSDEAVGFIERNRDGPFFLMLAYNAGLPPYQPPGLPPSEWDKGWDVNEAERQDYVRMVERMDEGIARVLEALDNSGISDDTLVIYTYDHGGRHLVDSTPLFHGFANLWEGGIRVPLILRYPGRIAADTTSTEPAIAMDLTATMLGAAGLDEASANLDGVDLLPRLRNARSSPARPFFWRADLYGFGSQRAAREGRWKYMQHDSTQFLFDVADDPGERRNLFAERPDVVRRLRADLAAWEARMDQAQARSPGAAP